MNSTNRKMPLTVINPAVQIRELLVFLFLITPSMILSLFAIRTGTLGFTISAYAIIFRDLGLISLVAFFLWRNGEAFHCIGWKRTKVWPEISVGILMFLLMAVSASLVETILKKAGLSSPSTQLPTFLKAHDYSQFVLAFVLIVVVAIAEETIFRNCCHCSGVSTACSFSLVCLRSASILGCNSL
jgi:membrane protease YdiL (CAAX protease family)